MTEEKAMERCDRRGVLCAFNPAPDCEPPRIVTDICVTNHAGAKVYDPISPNVRLAVNG